MSHRGLRAKIVLPCLPGGIGFVIQREQLNRELPSWILLRNEILRRDNFTCRRCRRHMLPSDLVIHHKRWVSRGGGSKPSNLLTVCQHPAGGCHAYYHPWLQLQGWEDPKLAALNSKSD